LSAFAVIYECSNTPADPGVLERVMERLKHRGPDGSDVFIGNRIAMGHWHFWTTPEEVEERQPLTLDGMPFRIVFDGRIDNRPELLSQLGMTSSDEALLSDAALVLHAYARWGADCLQHFIGEFAFAIFDERRAELFCARDALGDRTLFYSIKGARFVLASEPWAVAGADTSASQLNETAVAHYFALKATEDGQTLFKNVYELMPAHGMIINASGQRSWRFWQPDPSRKIRGRSDAEYAEEFRSLLDESVRCRLRSNTPVGVLMSGGLDSTSVASLAARRLAPTPLTTISYVFDEWKDCDERIYIDAMKSRWNICSIQIPCDDAWPFKNWSDWPHNPNYPEGNPYRLLKERAYARAGQAGLRVLLTGGFGDHLYSAGVDWLADLLVERRLVEAVRELSLYFRYAGLRWTFQSGFLQRVAKRWLAAVPGGQKIKRRRTVSAWLTSFSDQQIFGGSSDAEPGFGPYENMLGPTAALSSSAEIFHASRHALELRHPYRDRRLVEYVLSLPAYQLYYHDLNKRVLRSAMQGILPDIIRFRLQPTSLGTLFLQGVKREKSAVETLIHASAAVWRKFIRADWLSAHWSMDTISDTNELASALLWVCASYVAWSNHPLRSQTI